jgi:hypothetical protein
MNDGCGEPTVKRDGKMYPHWTVTEGMSGWFAVKIWWNPEMGGFPEPWISGNGRYQLESEAIAEGRDWAREEELPFYRRGFG